jgi:hypothetical protein
LERHAQRHTGVWEEFMKYAVEIGLGAMTVTQSYVKIGSGIEKLLGREWVYTDT